LTTLRAKYYATKIREISRIPVTTMAHNGPKVKKTGFAL